MKIDDLLPDYHDILDAISQGRRIQDVLQLVLDRACELVGAHHGSLMLVNQETASLLIVCTTGADWTSDKSTTQLKIGKGITGLVAETGKPYLCANTETDSNCVVLFPSLKSEVAVPVIIHERVWAVINMDAESYAAFDEDAVSALTTYAKAVSFTMQPHVKPGLMDVMNPGVDQLVRSIKEAGLQKRCRVLIPQVSDLMITVEFGGVSYSFPREPENGDWIGISYIPHTSVMLTLQFPHNA